MAAGESREAILDRVVSSLWMLISGKHLSYVDEEGELHQLCFFSSFLPLFFSVYFLPFPLFIFKKNKFGYPFHLTNFEL